MATIEKEIVEEKKWISHEEMLNMLAIGEATPGPISINLATFIGYKMFKFWGAFFCTVGFTLPSLIVISIISLFIDYVTAIPVLAWMFQGIRAGVVIMIGNAWQKFFKRMDKHWFSFLIFFMAFFISFFTELNVIYIILIGAALGLLYSVTVSKIRKDKETKIKKIEAAFEQDKINYNIKSDYSIKTTDIEIINDTETEQTENNEKNLEKSQIKNLNEKFTVDKEPIKIEKESNASNFNDCSKNSNKEDKL